MSFSMWFASFILDLLMFCSRSKKENLCTVISAVHARQQGSFCPIRERTIVVTSSQILSACCTNRRPGDKDHAASAQTIVGGTTIKETTLINENRHPWPRKSNLWVSFIYTLVFIITQQGQTTKCMTFQRISVLLYLQQDKLNTALLKQLISDNRTAGRNEVL